MLTLTIYQREKLDAGYRKFRITIAVKNGYGYSSLSQFNENGYLNKLIHILCESGTVSYLVSSHVLLDSDRPPKNIIPDITSLAEWFFPLVETAEKKIRGGGSVPGVRQFIWVITNLQNLQAVINKCLASMESYHYFFFAKKELKDEIVEKAKKLGDLTDKEIATLASDVIEIDNAELELYIITRRYTINQIKEKILSIVDKDKVEVKIE